MKKKVIITGANGFLGEALVSYLKDQFEVIAIVRCIKNPIEDVHYELWDGKSMGPWSQHFNNSFAIINLAGRSVDCRYNDINKAEIYASRLDSTNVIGQAIAHAQSKPRVWLNTASATIYIHSLDKAMTEDTGEIGSGFSVDVCKKWEACFINCKVEHVRQVALRTSIVIGKNGGVMIPFLNLVKYGLGGKMGNGNQMFSWIHVIDFCRAIEYLLLHEECSGAFNIASPNPISNKVFMQTLRHQYKISFGIPLPKFLLELGARFIKTETELILKSRYVIPKRLVENGFTFQYPGIESAVHEIIYD